MTLTSEKFKHEALIQMFDFLKPRRKVDQQSIMFANSALDLWVNPGPKTREDFATLVEMGCDKDRLALEMTAFTIFSIWYGISTASEQGKLSVQLYQRLENSFFSQIRSLTENVPLPIEVSLSYDSLGEMLSARFEHYRFLSSDDSSSAFA